jgi:hypothetical protein
MPNEINDASALGAGRFTTLAVSTALDAVYGLARSGVGTASAGVQRNAAAVDKPELDWSAAFSAELHQAALPAVILV